MRDGLAIRAFRDGCEARYATTATFAWMPHVAIVLEHTFDVHSHTG
jgi:hypothetical protein